MLTACLANLLFGEMTRNSTVLYIHSAVADKQGDEDTVTVGRARVVQITESTSAHTTLRAS